MSEKKHIDRLFQESFKDFEATPSDAVWKNIEANLNKKKKRRMIPIWWRYAGVAALLLLLLTIGGIFKSDTNTIEPVKITNENVDANNNETNNTNGFENNSNTVVSNSDESKVVSKDESKKLESSSKNIITQHNTSISVTSSSRNTNRNHIDKNSKLSFNRNQNNETINNTLQNNSNNNVVTAINSEGNNSVATVNKDQNKNNRLQNKSTQTNPITSNNTIANVNNALKEKEDEALAENKKEETLLTIEEALEENKTLLEDTKKTSRWAVAPNAAPVYFNTLGEGSSIDAQFIGNAKSGEVNMSYGISASYVLNNKISIRSGINKVNLGYNTNDVIIFQTAGVGIQSSLKNVSDGAISNTVADNNVSIANEANFNEVPLVFNPTNTTLNQTFGYIEVPLEIEYALSDKKLGVNVIGGFSSFFLNNNKIFSEAENGTRTFLGEANNLNKVSYSANFGLGFNYKISKKLDLNLEPMFKYQINTFNNTSGNFNPFIIGVYTGFAIKF